MNNEKELGQLRARLQQKADEHNAKVNLALDRFRHLRTGILSRPDVNEILPLISDSIYYATVMTDGLWLTSFVEADGDIIKAWDLVDQKRADQRDEAEQIIDRSRSDTSS